MPGVIPNGNRAGVSSGRNPGPNQSDIVRPSMTVAETGESIAGPKRPESIEELFSSLESPLLGCALRLAGERGAAEDIVQEAFMRLHSQFSDAWALNTPKGTWLNW